jgi:hypothetical protein
VSHKFVAVVIMGLVLTGPSSLSGSTMSCLLEQHRVPFLLAFDSNMG